MPSLFDLRLSAECIIINDSTIWSNSVGLLQSLAHETIEKGRITLQILGVYYRNLKVTKDLS